MSETSKSKYVIAVPAWLTAIVVLVFLGIFIESLYFSKRPILVANYKFGLDIEYDKLIEGLAIRERELEACQANCPKNNKVFIETWFKEGDAISCLDGELLVTLKKVDDYPDRVTLEFDTGEKTKRMSMRVPGMEPFEFNGDKFKVHALSAAPSSDHASIAMYKEL
jgi:hypothetical protein